MEKAKERLALPQMVLVGGYGRNDGKTALACGVIAKLQERVLVWGLKVICVENPGQPCHRGEAGCGLCGGLCGAFDIREEQETGTGKDTALMRQAGAERAFLLRSRPESMGDALRAFVQTLPKGVALVCESNRMHAVAEPGVFLFAARAWPPREAGKPGAEALAGQAQRIVTLGQPPPEIQIEKTDGESLRLFL